MQDTCPEANGAQRGEGRAQSSISAMRRSQYMDRHPVARMGGL